MILKIKSSTSLPDLSTQLGFEQASIFELNIPRYHRLNLSYLHESQNVYRNLLVLASCDHFAEIDNVMQDLRFNT